MVRRSKLGSPNLIKKYTHIHKTKPISIFFSFNSKQNVPSLTHCSFRFQLFPSKFYLAPSSSLSTLSTGSLSSFLSLSLLFLFILYLLCVNFVLCSIFAALFLSLFNLRFAFVKIVASCFVSVT